MYAFGQAKTKFSLSLSILRIFSEPLVFSNKSAVKKTFVFFTALFSLLNTHPTMINKKHKNYSSSRLSKIKSLTSFGSGAFLFASSN